MSILCMREAKVLSLASHCHPSAIVAPDHHRVSFPEMFSLHCLKTDPVKLCKTVTCLHTEIVKYLHNI